MASSVAHILIKEETFLCMYVAFYIILKNFINYEKNVPEVFDIIELRYSITRIPSLYTNSGTV
jgi:hypothetical protein